MPSLLADVESFCQELRPIEELCYLEHRQNEQLIPLAKKYNLLGMQLTNVTPELKSTYDLWDRRGVLILDPGKNSDAPPKPHESFLLDPLLR